MPSIEKHVKISIIRTNKSYREIHEWIDGPEHKDDRHDITKIPETYKIFKEKYGEDANREYVQHTADDLNGKFNHLIEDVHVLVDNTLAYFSKPIISKVFRRYKENSNEMDNQITCSR